MGRLKTAEGAMEYSAPQIAGRDEPFRSAIREHLKGHTQGLEDLAIEMLARGWRRALARSSACAPSRGVRGGHWLRLFGGEAVSDVRPYCSCQRGLRTANAQAAAWPPSATDPPNIQAPRPSPFEARSRRAGRVSALTTFISSDGSGQRPSKDKSNPASLDAALDCFAAVVIRARPFRAGCQWQVGPERVRLRSGP
jgi:hypothetical protein